ncbi:MAG TPA: hypothetical protein IAC88_07385 [Candidatus Onthosoma merdavium]|uniref:Uncharacterized protein n=1 Tax=Massilicoli timonensis TaxID=2015901 RepID=A0ABT1SLL8_9FIRM|nr:hypothetical protein [Massilicoli timonensis]HIR16394.1 hypothetical protein [Candidatus Onthosoma merdavium]
MGKRNVINAKIIETIEKETKAKEIMLINIVITSLIYLRSIRDKERCFDSFTGLHHDVFKVTGIA